MNEHKKLFRSRKNRVIGGISWGLGEYFGIDPILVRIGFVLLALGHGFGILLYLILMIVIPNEPELESDDKKSDPHARAQAIKETAEALGEKAKTAFEEIKQNKKWFSHGRNFFGLILVAIGLIMFANILFPIQMRWFRWESLWPAIIIFFGIYLIFKKNSPC